MYGNACKPFNHPSTIRDAEKVLDGNACLSCLTLSIGVIGWTALGRGQVCVCRGGYGPNK